MAVSYNYNYVYGNGDFYSGTGYTNASAGYYDGLTINFPNPNETGSTGYYYIYNVTDLGDGFGTEGFVQVDGYYDAETASTATFVYDANP